MAILLDTPEVIDGIEYDHLIMFEFQLELSGDGVSTFLHASLAPARMVDGVLTPVPSWILYGRHVSLPDVRAYMLEQAGLSNMQPANAWESVSSLLVTLLDGVHE